MINQLFAVPEQHMTPESVVAEYFTHVEESVLLMSCPRCASLNIKMLNVESRRMVVCHECGELCEAPPVN